MSTPDLTQPLPDPHWAMPSPAGEVLLAIFGGAAAVFVTYCDVARSTPTARVEVNDR